MGIGWVDYRLKEPNDSINFLKQTSLKPLQLPSSFVKIYCVRLSGIEINGRAEKILKILLSAIILEGEGRDLSYRNPRTLAGTKVLIEDHGVTNFLNNCHPYLFFHCREVDSSDPSFVSADLPV